MKKPIYLCRINLGVYSKRGNTSKLEKTQEIILPMVEIDPNQLKDDSYEMLAIAKSVIPTASRNDAVSMFKEKYRIRSIDTIKQVGETIDRFEEDEENIDFTNPNLWL
jgi:hypothetical protein